MPTLLERFSAFFAGQAPTRRITIYNERHTPRYPTQTLDVDRVYSIIEGAEDGDPRQLFALYNDVVIGDTHIQCEFEKRKLAVLGDSLSIAPWDKEDPADHAAAEFITQAVDDCDEWLTACIHLLDSTLYPVAVIEKVFRPSTKAGVKFEIAELVPVSPQLLDYTTGKLKIRETDPLTGQILGGLLEPDPGQYIVHRGHLLTSPDYRGGPMRSVLMWWLLGSMSRDWWARFLDRYGSPFLVGKYDQADDASRGILERAFSWAVRIGGLVVSKQTEVEVMQASASQSGDAYETFLAVCQREKSKLILGQTLSAESQPLGIGGGASKTHEGVRQDIRQWDAAQLASVLRRRLFRQLLEINGLKGRAPRITWGGESAAESQLTGTLLAALQQAGLQVTDEGINTLSEKIGLPLERVAAPVLPAFNARRPVFFSASPDLLGADDANDAIARNGSAELAQAFRGALAPVRQLILDSTSAEDLQRRIAAFYADWPVRRVVPLIEQALVAYALNRAALDQ